MLPELLSVMSWEEFISFFQYPFVWRAVVVGTLIALVAALLGVTLVLKRFSFIGDGLSHVAFGAMAVAAVAGLTNQMIVILPVTILAAVLLLRSGRKAKVNGDAQLALISVSALAIGYLIYNLSGSSNVSGGCVHDAVRLYLHFGAHPLRPLDERGTLRRRHRRLRTALS